MFLLRLQVVHRSIPRKIVGSGQWIVGGGQWIVGGEEIKTIHCPLSTINYQLPATHFHHKRVIVAEDARL
jgi:hypothetical protein